MDGVKSEWPLIVFTTLAPLCAGSWIVASSLALFDVPRSIVLTTGIPGWVLCLLLFAALGCSTLHLGKPLKALRAFARLGNSTVSNEVFMGALFAAGALLYVVTAESLAFMSEIWKMLLVLVVCFASLFLLFQCLAYRIRTVLTWKSFAFSVEFACIALMGGLCIEGVLVGALLPESLDVRVVLVVLEVACCLATIALVHVQGATVAKGAALRKDTTAILDRWSWMGLWRTLAVLVGSAIWSVGMLFPEASIELASIGALVVVAGIVLGRYSFYRFYLNVGLS